MQPMENQKMATKNQQNEKKSLPDIQFLLVRTDKSVEIIPLDDHPKDTISAHFIKACEKFGQDNVRVCKVISAHIRTEVEFIDG